MGPVKFGVAHMRGGVEYIAAIAERARKTEQLGYDSVWYGEHFVSRNPHGEAFVNLSVAAGATERVQVGTGVLLLPLRHPFATAKAATTLDIASRGRLLLGVGVGGEYPQEYEAVGVPFRERGARADEALEIIRKLWTGQPVTHEGRFWQLRDVVLAPQPTQRPHPPILVGGRTEAALRRAARYGDGWMPYFYTPKQYREDLSKIRQYAKEAGRSLDHFETAVATMFYLAESKEEGLQVSTKTLGFLYNLRDGSRMSSDFAAKVARTYAVTGTASDCIAQLEAYVDAGARHIVLGFFCDPGELLGQLETVARKVLPHFR